MLSSLQVKVLHITHGYFPECYGGIEVYLRTLLATQRNRGMNVQLLSGSMELRSECEIEVETVDGSEVHRLHRDDLYFDHYAHSYHPKASQLIRDLIVRVRPDVVHVHQWIRLSSDLVGIANHLGIPTVVTLHDVYTSCPRAFRVDRDHQPCARELSISNCAGCVPKFGHETQREVDEGISLFREQYQAELQTADRILVGMQVTADLISATTGLPLDRFTVQPLPYQLRFEGVQPRAEPGSPFRFGYWGSLTHHKGSLVLTKAFRSLVSQSSIPVELHLFGPVTTKELKASLDREADGLPVVFHGAFSAEDLTGAKLDAGVFPVLCFETFGLGLTECFELGLPSIVSDIGALGERVGDGGLKVPPGDIQALSAAMGMVAEDAQLRQRLVDGIGPLPPTPEEHAVELERIYSTVHAEPRRPTVVVSPERRATFLLLQREARPLGGAPS